MQKLHYEMLNDQPRTLAYRTAIERAKQFIHGRVSHNTAIEITYQLSTVEPLNNRPVVLSVIVSFLRRLKMY